MMVTVTDSGNGLMTGRAKEENNKGRARERERVVGKERTIETQMRKFSERRKAHHSN